MRVRKRVRALYAVLSVTIATVIFSPLPDGRVYLWGFEVSDPERLLDSTTGDVPYYVAFSEFADMGDDDENALAARAIAWLDEILSAHPETIVVHYSDYEARRRKFRDGRSHKSGKYFTGSSLRSTDING